MIVRAIQVKRFAVEDRDAEALRKVAARLKCDVSDLTLVLQHSGDREITRASDIEAPAPRQTPSQTYRISVTKAPRVVPNIEKVKKPTPIRLYDGKIGRFAILDKYHTVFLGWCSSAQHMHRAWMENEEKLKASGAVWKNDRRCWWQDGFKMIKGLEDDFAVEVDWRPK